MSVDIELFSVKLGEFQEGYFKLSLYCSIPDVKKCKKVCIRNSKFGQRVKNCEHLYFRIEGVIADK